MRPPRYRFPNEVRTTARGIASRMVQGDAIAQTPEELDAWISGHPDVLSSLERGGYRSAFGAGDLFPLLLVFVVQAGGSAPAAEPPAPPSSRRTWLVVLTVGVLLALVAFAVGMGVSR